MEKGKQNGILYIIGNGFDLHHNLHTSTCWFREYLKREKVALANCSADDLYEWYGVNWSDFEESLSTIDLDLIESEHMQDPDYLSDHEYDRDGTIDDMNLFLDPLEDALRDALKDMVAKANADVSKMAIERDLLEPGDNNLRSNKSNSLLRHLPYNFLSSNDKVISFNYTMTLELLYNIPVGCSTMHIHGSLDNNDNCQLIYGYGRRTGVDARLKRSLENPPSNLSDEDYQALVDDRDYYIDKQRECILDFYDRLHKDYQYDLLSNYLKESGSIRTVIVLGHSMAEVDSGYMELIETLIHPARWYVWTYEDSCGNHNPPTETLSHYSFKDRIVTFDSQLFKTNFPRNILGNI